VTGPPRTVDEVAAPYVNFLVRVPPGGPGVCTVCHSTVNVSFTRCYQCGPAVQVLGNATADLTAFVSMAPRSEQLARELFTYKHPNVRAEDRQRKTAGLAAVLWKWLGTHKTCLVNRLGISDFDLITSVPSTSGRLNHPLKTVVAGVVSGSGRQYADLLSLARGDLDQRAQAARFRATSALGGARVLVIDDTWTSGAKAQSASAALKAAGAQTVAVVAIGRWFNPGYSPPGTDAESWLAEHRRPGWDWLRCCLDPG
jgi:predicted amidophosphoribosyltransferase